MKNNNWDPRTPVLCLPATKDYAKKQNRGGDWLAVYEKRERYNAGIYAVEYSIRHSNEIHLWGFDSMYSNDLTSQMDTLVPRPGRAPLNKWWRPNWRKLFELHPDVKFSIHIPKGERCEEYPENVTICEETMAVDQHKNSQPA